MSSFASFNAAADDLRESYAGTDEDDPGEHRQIEILAQEEMGKECRRERRQ